MRRTWTGDRADEHVDELPRGRPRIAESTPARASPACRSADRQPRAMQTPTAPRRAALKIRSSVTRQSAAGDGERSDDRRVAGEIARQHQPDQRHHEHRRDAEHPVHEHRRDRVAAADVQLARCCSARTASPPTLAGRNVPTNVLTKKMRMTAASGGRCARIDRCRAARPSDRPSARDRRARAGRRRAIGRQSAPAAAARTSRGWLFQRM